MGFTVMCCGCGRFMGVDGKPIPKSKEGTVATFRDLTFYMEDFKKAAEFETPKACDKAAVGFGWTANDGDHRCPDCAARKVKSERPGAYIPTELDLL